MPRNPTTGGTKVAAVGIGVRRPTAALRHTALHEFGQRLLPGLLLDVQRQA